MERRVFQGTDGVRGLALAADHPLARGKGPFRAYLERGILTEEFVERYCFSAAKWLLGGASDKWISPNALVLAWDPRDAEGIFSEAAQRGLLRSGAHVLAAGVFPTPASAVYLSAVGGAGAVILTASHNPADQNGIKIFRGPEARKLLPGEDAELSRLIWEQSREDISLLPEGASYTESGAEARQVYLDYIDRLPNSWLPAKGFAGWCVVLDPGRGAWSGIASEVVEEKGPDALEEVNRLGSGPVNEGGGVVALEGRVSVDAGQGGLIRNHAALSALFEAGRARVEALREGAGFAAAGVFDADGDRAYTLFYDPFADSVRVLGGDECLVLQARFLAAEGELPAEGVAVVTIESDAGAACALAETGLAVKFAPVGDKWVLRAARRWGDAFALGGEESGHTVVPGRLVDASGRTQRLAVGDGLKSFLNTCAAVRGFAEGREVREMYAMLERPFPRGYKKTLYAYHVDRSRFAPGSETWEAAAAAVREAAARALPSGFTRRWVPLEDDPSVLYLAVEDEEGRPRASLYVRNSGTERKTGVTLRGPAAWGPLLRKAGEAGLCALLPRMKDEEDPAARAEEALLRLLARSPAETEQVDSELARDSASRFGMEIRPDRIREEALRGGLIEERGGRWALSALGRWHLENWRGR